MSSKGQYAEATELDREIKKLAKRDRAKWFGDRLTESVWDPVRLLGRDRVTKVVRLKVENFVGGNPAQIYSKYLKNVQWSND
eukprot:6125225-Alexandrium_andersonii.AAC.1